MLTSVQPAPSLEPRPCDLNPKSAAPTTDGAFLVWKSEIGDTTQFQIFEH